MKRKTERLLIDQKALRQGLTGKVEREDRSAWHVGGTQQLTGRRLSLLRCRKSDSRGMINHDVFRSWNRYRSANDHLHVLLSLIIVSSREESASENIKRLCYKIFDGRRMYRVWRHADIQIFVVGKDFATRASSGATANKF